jgi:NAD(P)H-dependent flavin oxidoreductase YrpB (nitropropane dioxygenase family)
MVTGIHGAAGRVIQAGKGMIIKHPVLSAAAAAGAVGMLGGAGVEALMTGPGGAPRGFHRCKSKHGCKHGEWVRNRHMNPCNPRALRRAIRRATRFTRLAMKTIHLVHPKKKGRFGGFKKRRRAA